MPEGKTIKQLRQQKNQSYQQAALMFTSESNSCTQESGLTFENDDLRARNFSSDSSILSDSLIGEARRKVDIGNGWAMAEGLISVFMQVGQRDPHTIVFHKLKTQTEDELDCDRHGPKSESTKNVMLSLGSSRQSYFIEKTVGAQSESKSTKSFTT